jgi:hypothetical protein
MIGRGEVVAALSGFLAAHEEFADASLVVLGTAGQDSSAITTYYAVDVAQQHQGMKVRSLPDALAFGSPILFVDDIIGSGRQAAGVVRSWLGSHEVSLELGEDRPELPPSLQDLLKEAPVGFLFAAGFGDGVGFLSDSISDLMTNVGPIEVGLAEQALPTIFGAGAIADPQRQELIEFCRVVARDCPGRRGGEARRAASGLRQQGFTGDLSVQHTHSDADVPLESKRGGFA